MRLTEKENETLPIDVSCNQIQDSIHIEPDAFVVFFNTASLVLCFQIVLQTLLSFVFTCYGIVHISGGFKDMDASSELKNKWAHADVFSEIIKYTWLHHKCAVPDDAL